MTQFPSRPPRTRKELFERVRAVIAHGPYVMPEESRYNGSGAPGVFLEDLLGATAGVHDIPDAVEGELKWHSDRTSLVALFHKSPFYIKSSRSKLASLTLFANSQIQATGRDRTAISCRHSFKTIRRHPAGRRSPRASHGQMPRKESHSISAHN